MIPSYVVYPFAGLFIVVDSFAAVLGMRMCKEARLTWRWASVEGVVKSSKVIETSVAGEHPNTVFRPVVTYEYIVDGKCHVGNRVRVADAASSSRYADRVIAGYQVGAKVTVYYAPGSPKDAVLRRGNDGNMMGVPAIGIFFVLVGISICVGYYIAQNKGR